MVTEADFQRRRLLKQHLWVNANGRWLPAARDIVQSMRKHCMKAQESAGPLEIVKYNRYREAYMLDVDEWDETTLLSYTIDVHRWLWTVPAAEAPIDAKSWAEALPPWWFRPRTTPRYEPCRNMNHAKIWTTSAVLDGMLDAGWVWEWR
jgi:hypothetical protein